MLTGLIKTAPAGKLNPSVSRRIWSKAKTRPPPAESPPMTIFFGSIGVCSASGGGSTRYR